MRPYYFMGDGWGLTQLSSGEPFFVNTRDRGITTWIVLGGIWETFIDDIMFLFVKPGHVFFDVGSNMGYYTIRGGTRVGPGGAVYGFEPNPELFPYLAENVNINGFHSRIRLFNTAVGDAPGQAELRFGYSNMGGGSLVAPVSDLTPPIVVDVARIDDLIDDTVRADIIKIDVEGYEPLALRGMEQLLARSPDAVIVIDVSLAFWRKHGDPVEIVGPLAQGRDMFWIGHDGKARPITLDTFISTLETIGTAYVLFAPPAVHSAVPEFADYVLNESVA